MRSGGMAQLLSEVISAISEQLEAQMRSDGGHVELP